MHNQNKTASRDLSRYGITNSTEYWNLSPEELVEHSIKKDLGKITDSGAIAINTGKFTGRSPKDRFIVKDDYTRDTVDWNDINTPFEATKFDQIEKKMVKYLSGKELYVRDAYACADKDYALSLRLISQYPWSNQFAYNMFLRPTAEELQTMSPEWTILNAPEFIADPNEDGTRQENFAIINFTKKLILIGGTGYTGEIKKGIFSVLNCILPHEKDVLSMHCSANTNENGETAIFFGLSGTGKTTLSATSERLLIGDDEHGWSDKGIFNFEGGCYAKAIDLTESKEPEIYRAIKHRAILENIGFHEGTRQPDFTNDKITQNTRVSYPIYHIDNAKQPSVGAHPQNIFFLTCDAFGVLPPISKLTRGQAMYHFISGYTAKVAGTEEGIDEPELAFSAGFGAPFLPLHPTKYAKMLGEKMDAHEVNIWLVNTGWTGGPYGTGSRIKLKYTRAMINAALNGILEKAEFDLDPFFGLKMPTSCPDVPSEILNPKNTWTDASNYENKARSLAKSFVENFDQFADKADHEIINSGPNVTI
ncbi:MAG: phosphoenolpyruvate carboxykinase (ATP) [Bacteroidetes bacterium]|jgi:phosphoenolpyruvate carboxykinase (ATP)|nr:phosphoenolpyruvate carboxykinase (ATP) [Bacteroidota bacterium]